MLRRLQIAQDAPDLTPKSTAPVNVRRSPGCTRRPKVGRHALNRLPQSIEKGPDLLWARTQKARTLPGLFWGESRVVSRGNLVPRRGLEPPRLAAHGPEPCA